MLSENTGGILAEKYECTLLPVDDLFACFS